MVEKTSAKKVTLSLSLYICQALPHFQFTDKLNNWDSERVYLVSCGCLVVVCGYLLVVSSCLLVICGGLLVVYFRLWWFSGGLWLFAGGF